MRGSSAALSVAQFKEWEDVRDIVKEGVLSWSDVDSHIQQVLLAGGGDGDEVSSQRLLTSEQFLRLITVLDEAASGDEAAVEMKMKDENEDEDWGKSKVPRLSKRRRMGKNALS